MGTAVVTAGDGSETLLDATLLIHCCLLTLSYLSGNPVDPCPKQSKINAGGARASTDNEVNDVVAFLKALTGENMDVLIMDAFAVPVGDVSLDDPNWFLKNKLKY